MFIQQTDDISGVLRQVSILDKEVKKIEETSELYNNYEAILQHTKFTHFEDIELLREEMNLRKLLWTSLQDWKNYTQQWLQLPFSKVDAKEISQLADHYYRNVNRCKNLPPNPVLKEL